MFQDILTEQKGRIGIITINRPQVSNALARTTYGEIRRAVEDYEKDDSIGAILITGKGKHFSAGGDIVRFKQLIDSGVFLEEGPIEEAFQMSRAIRLCSKPVTAMINGVATGAGLSIALACDFRTGTAKSKLVMAFVKMGLSGDTGAIYFLNKLLGAGKAAEMIMTGTPVAGEEAFRLGLLNRLSEEDSLEADTMEFVGTLANMPHFAIRKQKELINDFFYKDLDEFSGPETKAMSACSRTADFKEAVNAFLEKRAPEFNK
ncbi:MAG: enoyl-CoA hydratase/isomerase family protein [Lachnospiraceae bacterium]|nr:enoyl-CoA hydratase/isomerase family protein [Lachnospiraceae bacterium]